MARLKISVISAAARAMAMSYKRAWLLLDSMNRTFAEPVTRGTPGGRQGGGAQLTPFGEAVLARMRRIEASAASATRRDVAALDRAARPDTAAAAPTCAIAKIP